MIWERRNPGRLRSSARAAGARAPSRPVVPHRCRISNAALSRQAVLKYRARRDAAAESAVATIRRQERRNPGRLPAPYYCPRDNRLVLWLGHRSSARAGVARAPSRRVALHPCHTSNIALSRHVDLRDRARRDAAAASAVATTISGTIRQEPRNPGRPPDPYYYSRRSTARTARARGPGRRAAPHTRRALGSAVVFSPRPASAVRRGVARGAPGVQAPVRALGFVGGGRRWS